MINSVASSSFSERGFRLLFDECLEDNALPASFRHHTEAELNRLFQYRSRRDADLHADPFRLFLGFHDQHGNQGRPQYPVAMDLHVRDARREGVPADRIEQLPQQALRVGADQLAVVGFIHAPAPTGVSSGAFTCLQGRHSPSKQGMILSAVPFSTSRPAHSRKA